VYICCHRAGKAKDLYSRSFLLDARDTKKRRERQARERRNREGKKKEREREREAVSGGLREDVTRVAKRKKRR
jgi:hypothetical protein